MSNIFGPAIRLMNSLTFPRKMAAVAFIFSLPVSVFLYLLISEINTGIEFAYRERLGLEYTQNINRLLQDMQQHRGMSNAFLSGAVSFEKKVAIKESEIEEDIKSIDEIDERLGELLQTTEQWEILKVRWQQHRRSFKGMKAQESFDTHTSIIDDILSLMTHAADTSNLNFDPYFDTSYLVQAMVDKLPRASEYAGQTRGFGAGAIATGSIADRDRARLSMLSGLFRSNMNEMESGLRKAFRENTAIQSQLEVLLEDTLTTGYLALDILDNKVIYTDVIGIQPEEYFDKFTRAINTNFSLNDAVTKSFKALLQERIEGFNRKKYFIAFGAIATLLIGIYFFTGNYISIMHSLSSLVKASKRIGKGVFDGDLPIDTKDEMADVTKSFNEMSRSLADFTGQLHRANRALENEIRIRKNAEEVLRESRRGVMTLMSNLPGMAYRCLNDQEWTMKFVSEGAHELTGYKFSELVENREISYAALIVPKDRESVWNDVQAALNLKKPFRLVYRIRHKSGREKWVWEQGRGVYSPEGELQALEGFIADITERVAALEALKESEEKYKVIANTASDAIITIKDDGAITFVNPAIEKIFGYAPREVIGKSITLLMPERLRDKHSNAVKRYLETGQRTMSWQAVELTGLHKDGHEIPLEISYGEFTEEGKNYFTGFIRDITDRKEAQKEKEYKNMLERFNIELEKLVSERTKSLISLKLADRVRTPNVVIGWTANKLIKRSDVSDKFTSGLKNIADESEKLEATVKEFESALISKQPVFHYENINDMIGSVIFIIVKEAADKDIKLSINLSEEELRINAQRDLLRMAFFTLFRNIVESTPAGGRITLDTSGDMDNVCLSVFNTGAGIPKEMTEKIFEPANGEKVYKFGMGFPLVKQIVTEHLGEIKIDSDPGKGTTFRIVFPSKWIKKA
jgi:PAS domain S-box-containing protein